MLYLMLQEPAIETKQEQEIKELWAKVPLICGKKYSLRGWWTFKQSNALQSIFILLSTDVLWIRDTMGVLYLSGM